MGAVREEFRSKNFLFEYDKPKRFRTSRCGSGIIYIAYRTLLMVYFIGSFIYVLINRRYPGHAFIYLTIWSYILITINMILLWVLSILYILPKNYNEAVYDQPMDKFSKATWIIYNVSLSASPLVTLVFWILLSSESTLIVFTNLSVHGGNTIATILDLFICAIPIRILHFWLIVLYGILYSIFTAIYWAAGGTTESGGCCIYPMLNWEQSPAQSVGWVAVILVVAVVIHVLMFLLSKLIGWILRKIVSLKTSSVAPQTEANIHTIA